MQKLVKGIIEFRNKVRPQYAETFARLALGQSPDALFIACSDSRVAVNVFASTDPGDLFVVRNVGNLVPLQGAEAAAIEFALHNLDVKDVVLCGHSECGAMQALLKGRHTLPFPNLREWLRHGDKALERLDGSKIGQGLAPHNRLSQLNVLQQIENLKSYPSVAKRIADGKLRTHAWWFELASATVHSFDAKAGKFLEIDESYDPGNP